MTTPTSSSNPDSTPANRPTGWRANLRILSLLFGCAVGGTLTVELILPHFERATGRETTPAEQYRNEWAEDLAPSDSTDTPT